MSAPESPRQCLRETYRAPEGERRPRSAPRTQNERSEPKIPKDPDSYKAYQTYTFPASIMANVPVHLLSDENISYRAERVIGNGSFGVVFEAKVIATGETVAIKKVLQDKRFKNRELQIMRQLAKTPHSNVVALQHCFYSQVGGDRTGCQLPYLWLAHSLSSSGREIR